MNNLIQGNFIGTDVHGRAALGNACDGVPIEWSQETTIGGPALGAANVIAYNGRHGVAVVSGAWEATYAQQNTVLANQIYRNGGLGIDLGGYGVTPNDPGESGIWQDPVVQAEFRAETPEGMPAVDVTPVGAPRADYFVDLIWLNYGPDGFGVSTDDTGTAHFAQFEPLLPEEAELIGVSAIFWQFLSRPNRFQDYPTLSAARVAEETQVTGTLNSTPQTTFLVEFFANGLADPSGHGEGETLLGNTYVTTNGDGLADFTVSFPVRLPPGHFLTATATDRDGNTSEFSAAVEVLAESLDLGDAPDPTFPTLLASNGARHALGSPLYLGWSVDADADGQPSEWADGDSMTGVYDEDGVVFQSPLVTGQWAAIDVIASAEGRLDAWIDFAADGTWADAKDHVFDGVTLLPGSNTLFFEVPKAASADTMVYARFRFSSAGGLGFAGPAVDGEVEDYVVVITATLTGNQPPTAVDDEATTNVSVPVAIDVTANDVDPEGGLDRRTVKVTTLPSSGHVFVDRASGVITYIPSTGYVGDDAFTYRVRDLEGLADTAWVIVHVLPGNQPPVAMDDTATTNEDAQVVIDVLVNDADPDDGLDPTAVTIIVPPARGAENYNFGEYGLRVEFIGKRLLLSSTPPAREYVANLQVAQGQSLVLVEAPPPAHCARQPIRRESRRPCSFTIITGDRCR